MPNDLGANADDRKPLEFDGDHYLLRVGRDAMPPSGLKPGGPIFVAQ
ncbi:hypothetical protein [Burkholderia alba]|nr:hypothetical protein [Burkholderia alba]